MSIDQVILKNQNYVIETNRNSAIDVLDLNRLYEGIKPTNANKAFLSIISHNIKNPFGALLGYTDLIFEDYDQLSDRERLLYVEEIRKTANLTFKYLERFFEWIYYKTNKVKFQQSEIILHEIVAQSIEKTLSKSQFNGEIILNIDTKIKIFADYDSIFKMINYLFENAVKYSMPNGEISINAGTDEKYTIIQIIDYGIGISEERLDKLFDISQNILLNEKGVKSGTGMGLILVEEILKMNKGTIKISSKINKGTVVSVKLPMNSLIY